MQYIAEERIMNDTTDEGNGRKKDHDHETGTEFRHQRDEGEANRSSPSPPRRCGGEVWPRSGGDLIPPFWVTLINAVYIYTRDASVMCIVIGLPVHVK
ncbi:hypothetical protein E2C01_086623 [Portunus trituberculatus]|uniref:Uncharacterized protein n=1 Tax=Portunus trituberculatus TaxID=210409 RepID=A0A5B7JF47_PORTR|nr:hypothetical protein [Portunus trituberculatus]